MFGIELTADALISLATLTLLEIVLGVDNIVFIAILVGRLPKHLQAKARSLGLGMALFTRLALLFSMTWIMQLTNPLFSLMDKTFSGRDLILIFGGLFLIAKATIEMFHKIERHDSVGDPNSPNAKKAATSSFFGIIVQILLLDVIFSLDSVITAVGMAKHLWIMTTAVIIAVGVMLAFSGKISQLIETHPSLKILALSFLLLIGVVLLADGFGEHISKGYIYFSLAFSLTVEMINIKASARRPS